MTLCVQPLDPASDASLGFDTRARIFKWENLSSAGCEGAFDFLGLGGAAVVGDEHPNSPRSAPRGWPSLSLTHELALPCKKTMTTS